MIHKVLFVDDEKKVLNSLRAQLKECDFEPLFAISGAEALQILEHEKVSLIISDLRMPKMNGIELLVKVREKYPDIIRMVLTAYAEIDNILASINEGNVYKYITKPWNKEDLKININQALTYYELINERNQLKKLDKLKDDFIVLISHELRTPLAIIISYIDSLCSKIVTTEEKKEEFYNTIKSSAEQLNSIIDNIKTISMLNSDLMPFKYTKININDLIKSTTYSFTSLVKKKNISLQFIDKLISPVIMSLDKEKIIQVMENILNNAIDFTEPGGEISTVLSEYFDNNIRYIKIIVKDSGIGISKENINTIWNKFEQVADVKYHSKGLGLGLPISKGFIEGHQGKIWITSKMDIGTEVMFILPIEQL